MKTAPQQSAEVGSGQCSGKLSGKIKGIIINISIVKPKRSDIPYIKCKCSALPLKSSKTPSFAVFFGPYVRRVGQHTVYQRGTLGILEFIGPGRVPLDRPLGGKLRGNSDTFRTSKQKKLSGHNEKRPVASHGAFVFRDGNRSVSELRS